jgi:catechol 2,3-dioxygenase-like lactoylglutathione lyase family enzyme
MGILVNNTVTVVAVTVFVAAFVVLLPLFDRRISKRLGLNLSHGVSENPKAAGLLKLRQLVLYAVFLLYAAAFAFIVFFSRQTGDAYQVHAAPLQDLFNAVRTDSGFADAILSIFRDGIKEGISHFHIEPKDVVQVYLNIMLFVPLGYLLPYVFPWFRARARIRPVIACLLISFITENLQLVFRRGLYDVDDILSNTFGGWIGQLLFISIAFVVTHPDWRKELRAYRRWRRHARTATLYPFAKRIALSRSTLLAADEEAVWQFYVGKLGFRVVKEIADPDGGEKRFLLEMGKTQVEIRCAKREEPLPPQALTISARNPEKIRARLLKNGIEPSEFFQDAYTGVRSLSFSGPDGVRITILEHL